MDLDHARILTLLNLLNSDIQLYLEFGLSQVIFPIVCIYFYRCKFSNVEMVLQDLISLLTGLPLDSFIFI